MPPTRGPTPSVSAPVLSRRERKKREVRSRIFQAAFELFVEQGFDATTVEQIAERADVGKGTVFNYFPRKISFLAAVADDWTSRLADELGPLESWRGTTREKLERVFRVYADLGLRNPALSRLAFTESLRYIGGDPAAERLTQEAPVRHFRALIRTLLKQGQRTGEVRKDVDPEHAAMLIESAFFRTLAAWLRDGGSANGVHREITAKLDIIFNGVAA